MQLIVTILSPTSPPRTIGDLTLEPGAPITIGGLETDTVWLGDGIDATHRLTMKLHPGGSGVEIKAEVFSADVGPLIFHRGDQDFPILAAGHRDRLPPTIRDIDIDTLTEVTLCRLTMCGVKVGLLFLAADSARHDHPWLAALRTCTAELRAKEDDLRAEIVRANAVVETSISPRGTSAHGRDWELAKAYDAGHDAGAAGEPRGGVDALLAKLGIASAGGEVLNNVADSMERLMEEGELDERESLYLSPGPHDDDDDDDGNDEPSVASVDEIKRPVWCDCQWEEGDSPCQVHGDIDPVETSISPRGTKAPPTHGSEAERRAAMEEAHYASVRRSREAAAAKEVDEIRSRIDAAGAAGGVQWIRVEVYRSNLHISGASFAAPCLIRIGALKSSEIFLQDEGVARLHAAIEAATDTVRLIDFGSASGTRLAGEEIDKNAELKDGDEIVIRGYRIVVHFDRAEVGDRHDKDKAAPSEESSACSDDHCFDDTTCAMGWADKADCDRMPSAARPASYAWLSRRRAGPGVKPLVYVAGPYTADTDEQRLANIAAAQAWGAKVIDAGGIPVIPHNMSEGIADKADAEFWYAATLELMLRCDAVLLMPRAGESLGARAEEEAAHESGMPVIDAGKLLPCVRLGDYISGIAVPTVDPHAAARRRRARDARELKRIKDLRSQVSELRQLRHVKGGDECN